MKTGISACFIGLLHLSSVLVHGYDNGDFEAWYQPVPRRPVDIAADVINDLGLRILQQYTSHGNVAFSPAGVGFILAALYEGSLGRGSQQIADALGLPRDRDVTRIGFRDIHRRLRTYLNADGFLGGLTLNQENTRLRPEYEDILRFYGFDLSVVEQGTNESNPETTLPPETDRPAVTTQISGSDGTKAGNEDDTTGTTEPAPSTTPSQAEQFETTLLTSQQSDRSTLTTTAAVATEPASTDAPTPSTTEFQTIGQDTTVPDEIPGTTANPETLPTTTTEMPDTSSPSSSSGISTSPPTNAETIGAVTSGSGAEGTTLGDTNPEEETVTVVPASSGATVSGSTEALTSAGSEGSAEPSSTERTGVARTDPGVSELPSESTTTSEPSTAAKAGEESSTIAFTDASMSLGPINDTETGPGTDDSTNVSTGASTDAPGNDSTDATTVGTSADESTVSTDTGSTDASNMNDQQPAATFTDDGRSTLPASVADDSTNRIRRRSIRSPRGYFSSYPDEGIWMQDLGIWKPYAAGVSEASVRDSTEISFLVNGCDVSSISASRYMAVLPFAYFPSLHAVALEFPLDDPRYNILLLMSTNRRDTYQLARDLGGKSLRLLRKQLQPTWVRATIPSFMLRGFVTLTSFLQRLGILDVFEPRTADLSVMTPDLGVYVRDVQQSIGVNIRNYMKPDRTHSRNGLFERAGPVPFTAVHPFLYFIVDAETSVALIAGRVNDPLNSRIL